jgi:hypothetical protein
MSLTMSRIAIFSFCLHSGWVNLFRCWLFVSAFVWWDDINLERGLWLIRTWTLLPTWIPVFAPDIISGTESRAVPTEDKALPTLCQSQTFSQNDSQEAGECAYARIRATWTSQWQVTGKHKIVSNAPFGSLDFCPGTKMAVMPKKQVFAARKHRDWTKFTTEII